MGTAHAWMSGDLSEKASDYFPFVRKEKLFVLSENSLVDRTQTFHGQLFGEIDLSGEGTLKASALRRRMTFRFRVDRKHFENRAFRKRWRHHNESHVIFPTEFSSNTNSK